MRTIIIGLFCTAASLAFSSQSLAGDVISDVDQLKAIFSDKTAKGINLKKEFSYQVYFGADGKVERITEDGDKHSGTWRISDDGMHCVHFSHKRKENCRVIKEGNQDGVYLRMKKKGDRLIKIIKLVRFRDGNKLPKEDS